MAVEEHRISRQEGDGARSPIEDTKSGEMWETNDQRADTRTTFYQRDIDRLNVSERRKKRLRRILRWQEGEQQNADEYDSRGQQNHKEDKRRLIGVLSSQLGLTPAQKRRVEHIIMDVVSVNSFGKYSSEQVILATINVIVREDNRWIEDEDEFRNLMVEVGIADGTNNEKADLYTMRRLRALVRERIPSR